MELGWKGMIPRKHLGVWCTKSVGKKRHRWVGTKVDCPKRRELWKEQGSQSELRRVKGDGSLPYKSKNLFLFLPTNS